MKVNEILQENSDRLDPEQFYIYYDYTGAGRGPEPIAGPFNSQSEAEEYMDDSNMNTDDGNVFIDLGHSSDEEQEEWHVKHTGENTDKSVAELEHEKASAKRHHDVTAERQKNFAIMAKRHWK